MTVTRGEEADGTTAASIEAQDTRAGSEALGAQRASGSIWVARGLYLVALVPLGLVGVQAMRAPRLHVLLDYWHVLAKVTSDDKSVVWGEVFSYHLEQPFVVPSLIFWADARLFGGDNRVLTVLAVGLVAAMVVLLRLMLPTGLNQVKKAALTVGFAFVLLSSHAAELWVQGTNGISWTPALFLSVLALYLIQRGLFWAVLGAAAPACLCFGAAFPVWLVVGLVAWLRRDSLWKVLVPLGVGVVVFGLWFVTRPAEQHSLATSAFDPSRRLSVVAAALGGLWSSGNADIAIIAGGVLAAVIGLFGWSAVKRRLAQSEAPRDATGAGWVGVGVFAVAVAVMLGLGRTTGAVPGNVGLVSRYVLICALATCAAGTLVVLRRPNLPARHIVAVVLAVGLVTNAIGSGKQGAVSASYAPLEVAAVALKVEARTALNALQIQPEAIPAARAMGMYPYNESFTLGCGGHELGDRIDLGSIRPLPGPQTAGATKGVIDTGPVAGDTVVSGWAVVDGRRADCVLVIDDTGVVVGGGVAGLARPDAAASGDGEAGWRAVAKPGAAGPAVVVSASGGLYRVDAKSAT